MVGFKKCLLFGSISMILGMPVGAMVDPIVSLSGSLRGESHGTHPGRDTVFVLEVVGHRTDLDVRVSLRAEGEMLDPSETYADLHLSNEGRVELTLDLQPGTRSVPALSAALGTIEARVQSGGETITVQYFYVASPNPATWRLLAPGQYESLIDARAEHEEQVNADRRAFDLAKWERGQGNRPVAFADAVLESTRKDSLRAPSSASQAAWNAIAEPQPLLPEPDPCNRYVLSGNYSYHVTGQLYFRDDYYSPAQTRAVSAGYPISFDTQVRYANICGDVYYSTQRYSTTTGASGAFDVAVSTSVAPGGGEPVVVFRATAPESGLASCGLTSCSLYAWEQSLTSFGGSWQGGNRRITPTFTASNSPYPFFFRWNEEIKSLKSRWATASFNGSYTPFTVAYVYNDNPPVYFSPDGPGLVRYDSANRWLTKWVMAHEFGHQFQYTLQGNHISGGGPHSICQAVTDAVGFVEGFADWHGSYWETEGRNAYFSCGSNECWSTCPQGYRREGNVMAFFWDVFDASNDPTHDQGLDVVVFGLGLLKSWANYSSFPSFYADFLSRGLWGGQAASVDVLRTVNKVTVAQ